MILMYEEVSPFHLDWLDPNIPAIQIESFGLALRYFGYLPLNKKYFIMVMNSNKGITSQLFNKIIWWPSRSKLSPKPTCSMMQAPHSHRRDCVVICAR